MRLPTTKKIYFISLLLGAGILFGNSLYIQAKAQLAQVLIASAWGKTIEQSPSSTKQIQRNKAIFTPIKPWSWADTHPVAKLSVPKMGVTQYVLAGATGAPLAFGPGHYAGTSLPGMHNSVFSTVIAGHNDTHFSFMKSLQINDEIIIENINNQAKKYKIKKMVILNIHHDKMPSYQNKNRLILVTCHPQVVGQIHPAERLVVIAEQVV